jgi:hypothetical protein
VRLIAAHQIQITAVVETLTIGQLALALVLLHAAAAAVGVLGAQVA